ncbi:hypothetical protein FQZ97_1172420 [compost metagenome]
MRLSTPSRLCRLTNRYSVNWLKEMPVSKPVLDRAPSTAHCTVLMPISFCTCRCSTLPVWNSRKNSLLGMPLFSCSVIGIPCSPVCGADKALFRSEFAGNDILHDLRRAIADLQAQHVA